MIDRGLRDGYELNRAALRHGYNVTLLPRQVLEVVNPETSVKSTFSHGVPQQTTLAAVTYAQDVRMRRDMVSRAGYRVPPGATFSVGASTNAPFRYAEERVGLPVVIKPSVGDNTIDVLTGIATREQMEQAIDYLHTPPAERPGYVRAAYALTELREPGEKDGRVVVPKSYRFLVEKQVPGEYLRFLVLQGQVISVVLCPDGPWKSVAGDLTDVTYQVHPSLVKIAEGASEAIPGMGLVAVDLVVADYREETAADEAVVVEYSERPWLEIQHEIDPALAHSLADKILESGMGEALSGASESITVSLLLQGSVHPSKLCEVFDAEAAKLGLNATTEISDAAMGDLRSTVHGAPEEIAFLLEEVLDEGINGHRAMLVEAVHQK